MANLCTLIVIILVQTVGYGYQSPIPIYQIRDDLGERVPIMRDKHARNPSNMQVESILELPSPSVEIPNLKYTFAPPERNLVRRKMEDRYTFANKMKAEKQRQHEAYLKKRKELDDELEKANAQRIVNDLSSFSSLHSTSFEHKEPKRIDPIPSVGKDFKEATLKHIFGESYGEAKTYVSDFGDSTANSSKNDTINYNDQRKYDNNMERSKYTDDHVDSSKISDMSYNPKPATKRDDGSNYRPPSVHKFAPSDLNIMNNAEQKPMKNRREPKHILTLTLNFEIKPIRSQLNQRKYRQKNKSNDKKSPSIRKCTFQKVDEYDDHTVNFNKTNCLSLVSLFGDLNEISVETLEKLSLSKP